MTLNTPRDETMKEIAAVLENIAVNIAAKENVINDDTASTSMTYSSSKILQLIAAINEFSIKIVETLPSEAIQTKTIYFVPKDTLENDDIYDEYIYINDTWEHIGSTAVDLSDYYKKSEVDIKINNINTGLANVVSTVNKHANKINVTSKYGNIDKLAEFTGTSETKISVSDLSQYRQIILMLFDSGGQVVNSMSIPKGTWGAMGFITYIYGSSDSMWGKAIWVNDTTIKLNRTSSNTSKLMIFGVV